MPEASQIAVLIPIIALMIPIVTILVKHQQRMAEIMSSQSKHDPQIDLLRNEVNDLKKLIHTQMIQVDSLVQSQRPVESSSLPTIDLPNRLEK